MIESLLTDGVVKASEMSRVEKIAFSKGRDPEKLMVSAGLVVANFLKEVFKADEAMETEEEFPVFYFFIGKGNNGGDGLVAALDLLHEGYYVKVFFLSSLDEVSELNRKFVKEFHDEGGEILFVKRKEDIHLDQTGVIIDAIFGTGFSGLVKGIYKEAIEIINGSSFPVIAIDIPSGVNGDNGVVENVAIRADTTISLSLLKTGFFLNDGYEYVGDVVPMDIGFSDEDLAEADLDFRKLDEEELPFLLPDILRKRHKYSAGHVVGFAGSLGMEGAAKLASLAAYRSGAGIVKLFVTKEMQMSDAPYELIKRFYEESTIEEIVKMANKASSVFIGPGLGRGEKVEGFLSDLLPEIKVPLVIDADALYFLAKKPEMEMPQNAIITPHRKEMLRLLGEEDMEDELLLELTKKYADTHRVVVLLKGAPSFIFLPKKTPFVVAAGTPGMATAGTGDVLTGIIASFLAQGLTTHEAALLAAHIHGMAGENASIELGDYSLMATDLIDTLPDIFIELEEEM